MVPRMFDAWVQVTKTVFSVSRFLRSETSSLGFVLEVGSHHFRVRDWRSARETQGAMLASWSSPEMMTSDPAGKVKAKERLRKSWVVADPRTGLGLA